MRSQLETVQDRWASTGRQCVGELSSRTETVLAWYPIQLRAAIGHDELYWRLTNKFSEKILVNVPNARIP
jgi:hypothetical protein